MLLNMKPYLLIPALLLSFLPSIVQASNITYQQLNKVLNLSLFADDNLWDDDDREVANRLEWPQEGRTSTLSSYRIYASESSKVIGSRIYSMALYGENSSPAQISLIFINKGDFDPSGNMRSRIARAVRSQDKREIKKIQKQIQEIQKEFPEILENEAERIKSRMVDALGEPQKGKFGASRDMRERVSRWDWKGHAILLSVQEGEYVSVKIMPTAFADAQGKVEKINDSTLRGQLAARVLKRENGDVIVTELPMADQGPKGYCVPATWERYLRYMGIPADMYVLAMAGGTNFGGGTYAHEMRKGVASLVRKNSRRIESESGKLKFKKVAKYIDNGLPMMWYMFVDHPLDSRITKRSRDRVSITDWEKWATDLEDARERADDIEINRENGHVCMIIGYNQKTEEIATTDSWGPEFKERWFTIEEANAINQGSFDIIKW